MVSRVSILIGLIVNFSLQVMKTNTLRLWRAGEEDKMGRNCSWLPRGITRTEMLAALGAFGEQEKAKVLQKVAKHS